jgi:uncharacterized damage-inducible protein DinB
LSDDKIIQLARLARGAEAGGFNNLAKILWALAYSKEIKTTNAAGIPRGAALMSELTALMDDLRNEGGNDQLIANMERGLAGIREDRTIPYVESPAVFVSRTCGDIYLGDPPERTACDDDPLALREFRPIWYMEAAPPAKLVRAMRTFPGMVLDAIEGLSEEQMNQRPDEAEWTLRELLYHFAMAQQVFHGRAEQMLAEENPTLKSVAVWAESSESSAADVLTQFRESREKSLALIEPLSPADWWRTAWHDEFGQMTLLEQASYFARHERSHIPQLMAIIRAVSA